jgi:hypothetical protein
VVNAVTLNAARAAARVPRSRIRRHAMAAKMPPYIRTGTENRTGALSPPHHILRCVTAAM